MKAADDADGQCQDALSSFQIPGQPVQAGLQRKLPAAADRDGWQHPFPLEK